VVTLEPESWLEAELDLFEDEPLEDEPLEDDPFDDEPLEDEPLEDEPLEAEPLARLVPGCCVELAVEVAPSDPVPAIKPKAIAKVAMAPTTTRRRIARALRARARRRSRTRAAFEVGGGVEVMPAS
jgi:hypothetical protein